MIWLLVLWGTGSLTIAPQTYATRADCEAVLKQVPKSAGSGKCVEAKPR